MRRLWGIVVGFLLLSTGHVTAQEPILISSKWGQVTTELVENTAVKALVRMLPITIRMRDHLRQEKTSNFPTALPKSRAAA